MKTTVQRGIGPFDSQSIEETRYGPPQHSAQPGDPERTFYGDPQHETDVVVNAEPRESRFRPRRSEGHERFDSPHRIPARAAGVVYP